MKDNVIMWGLFILIAAIFVGWGAAIVSCGHQRQALETECVASGKPHFECKAMFQNYCGGNNTPTYIPMIIPTGGR